MNIPIKFPIPNATARRYDEGREKFNNRDVLEQFAALIRPRGIVLDVGCGAGVPVARFLVESGFSVIGIDISESMLELASTQVPEAIFRSMDMTNLSFPDESFDGVVACYSLIHVPMEFHQAVILDFGRMLKCDGALLFSCGSNEWEGIEDFYGAPMFWSHPHPSVTRQSVLDSGLELEFSEVKEHGGEQHYWVLARRS